VTATPGGITATGIASPIVVAGLTNGISYTFVAAAANTMIGNLEGTSPASVASNVVTPSVSSVAGTVASSIIGSWSMTTPAGHRVLFSFFPNGDYVQAEDGPADASGQSGLERGTYAWNSTTGAFSTPCPTVDTNGQWGFSHPVPNICSGNTSTLTISGNTMTINTSGQVFYLTRVTGALPIIGSWSMTTPAGHRILFSFFANGDYVQAEDGPADASGQSGLERGTYAWNSTTGAFSTPCPTVDTNGQWGFSHPVPNICSGNTSTLTISGNTMTINTSGQVFYLNQLM